MLIYITGLAGAGKSAVCAELLARGYDACDADLALSAFFDVHTGARIPGHTPAAERTEQWRERHAWRMSRQLVEQMRVEAEASTRFVCGVASNEEECLDLFDQVYALEIDLETVEARLASRTTGDFGRTPHELKMLREWAASTDAYYDKIGAIRIDATQPLSAEVDEILRRASER
jgi:shikimate kinase